MTNNIPNRDSKQLADNKKPQALSSDANNLQANDIQNKVLTIATFLAISLAFHIDKNQP